MIEKSVRRALLVATIVFAAPAGLMPSSAALRQSAESAPQASVDPTALKREFDDMARYLARRAVVGADERLQLRRLLEKVRPVAATGDAQALAMQVQIATWLDDGPLLDEAFRAVLDATPRNDVALSQWVASLTRRGLVDQAMAEVAARTQDLVPFPRTALALAETLIAANRPDDAKTMFDGMRTVFAERPELAGRAKMLGQRIDALTSLFFIERNQRTIDAQKDELPRVELVTSKGAILVELFAQQAPNSAEAFLSFVEKNVYAGTKFHRRIPGLALFGGDPNTKVGATGRPGFGSPGFRLPDEGRRSDRRLALGGTIGLAKALTQAPPPQPGQPPLPRTVENSAGATFFILLAPAEFLHDEFTIVGRILEGMDVVAALGPSDEIVSAKIVRAGNRIQQLATSPELPTPLELTILESAPNRSTAEVTRGRGPLPPGARGLPAPNAPNAPNQQGQPSAPR